VLRLSKQYDVIVVGGGSAGCAAAARLSEDPRRRVLLLEAGPDPQPIPDLVDDASRVPELWQTGYVIRFPTPRNTGPGTFDSLAGRIMGGGSAVNWMNVARPIPEDFEDWVKAGNPEWSWDHVLPVLRRIEADQDFPESPLHGAKGPLYVKRGHRFDRPIGGQQQAFIDGCLELGLPICPDQNDLRPFGVVATPTNVKDGRRQSTAVAYLGSARKRANLSIMADAHVTSVRLAGNKADGVRYAVDGRIETALAGEVVLCAGVYHTPQILVHSGIGPPKVLQRLGIDVICEVEGVGENYHDHAVVFMPFAALADRQEGWAGPRVGAYWKSQPGLPYSDVYILMQRAAPGESGRWLLPISVRFLEHRTRGRLLFHSADPLALPGIDAQMMVHPDDVKAVVAGMLFVRDLAATSPMRAFYGPLLEPKDGEDWARFAQTHYDSFHHGVGTCMLGPSSNPMAVVDQHLRVHGVSNLRVADASIMPTIPHAPTNLTCIMIGERLADFLRERMKGDPARA
jgi:choline dehydrogenase